MTPLSRLTGVTQNRLFANAWEFGDESELVFNDIVQVKQNLVRLAKIIDV